MAAKSNQKVIEARQALAKGDLNGAEDILRRIIKKEKNNSLALTGMGSVMRLKGKLDSAVKYLKKASSIDPSNIAALHLLGLTLIEKGDPIPAIDVLKRCKKFDPDRKGVSILLGRAYYICGDVENSIEWLKRAVKESPEIADYWSNLASAYIASGDFSLAKESIETALKISPDNPVFLNTKATIMVSMGHIREAIDIYNHALNKKPEDMSILSNYLLTLNYLDKDPIWIRREHSTRVKHVESKEENSKLIHNYRKRKARIRIGYVSSDFREHSVIYFFEPLLREHDRNKFDIYCYNNSHIEDNVTKRIRKYHIKWRDIYKFSDADVCKRISQDKIDILVDLNGHTAGNRLGVFIRRAAPIQVTWLGYPNTTGIRNMDYRITDKIADPTDDQIGYTEQLIFIEKCFLSYMPYQSMPNVTDLPALNNGYVTFGSFNNYAKLTDYIIEIWAQILKKVQHSKIILKNPSFSDKSVMAECYERFILHGIDEQRIELLGPTREIHEHLSTYCKVDIALDTYPYTGTTTTCEALFMGVPVITLSGDRHASRVGKSILSAAGFSEWAHSDEQGYIKCAVQLADDLNRLQKIRSELRSIVMGSDLCNHLDFARRMEQVYMHIL